VHVDAIDVTEAGDHLIISADYPIRSIEEEPDVAAVRCRDSMVTDYEQRTDND